MPKVVVPDDLMEQWQGLVNTLATVANIPAGLIMRLAEEDIEVLVASQSQGNPYGPGDKEHFSDSGLYCETVIRTKQPLLVPDALSDPHWKDNPDVKLEMVSYLGFPILFPDGTPFGTLCILDRKPNSYSDAISNLIENFRNLIQAHLALLYLNTALGEKNKTLIDYLEELQSLRGLIAICSQCKKIRDSEGNWHSIEKYLVKHPEASFTHGYCPACHQDFLVQLQNSSQGGGTLRHRHNEIRRHHPA